jgi:hypothetical protein
MVCRLLSFIVGVHMKKFPWLLASLAAGSVFLSGCYTQLYTNAYAERARDYRRAGDEDSALAKARAEGDTLAPADSGRDAADRKTVIVNNYYEDAPAYSYRGYSTLDWDYPIVSFGFYSSRYQSYYDPYWWHEPYHRGYGGHRGGRHDHDYGSYSSGGGGGGGPREDHRIFSPAPDYPELHKGRRSYSDPAPAPAPVPKVSSESGQNRREDPPPRDNASSDNQKKDGGDSHPSLQKGKRR